MRCGKKTIDSVLHDLLVRADRRRDDWSHGRHVLNEFVPALTALPWFIRKRHDPYVEFGNISRLSVFRPGPDLRRHAVEANVPRADHYQACSSLFTDLCKGRGDQGQVSRRAR